MLQAVEFSAGKAPSGHISPQTFASEVDRARLSPAALLALVILRRRGRGSSPEPRQQPSWEFRKPPGIASRPIPGSKPCRRTR